MLRGARLVVSRSRGYVEDPASLPSSIPSILGLAISGIGLLASIDRLTSLSRLSISLPSSGSRGLCAHGACHVEPADRGGGYRG